MDIIAITLVLWLVTALLMRSDDDDDFHGGVGNPQITVITRRCDKRRV